MTAHMPDFGPGIVPTEFLTIGELRLSPFNVRTNEEDARSTGALELSILALGLIHPLRVHPMRGSKTVFGVHAGGRRYRSIKALVDRGDLPADWPVPVHISRGLTDAELLEESVAENAQRKDLRPYEEYAGVARAHRMGDSVRKIAERIGQDERWVERAIRIGTLAPPIFKALADDQVSLEQARAYAATEDHALQLAAFEDLHRLSDWEKTPAKIRARLRFDDAELGRLLRFVGDEAYRAAGGRFELDLFADAAEERGRVVDDALLRDLVDRALADLKDEIRVRAEVRDLRFVQQAPRNDYGTDWTLQISPRLDASSGRIELPEGDVVAMIKISDAGEPEVSYWWESRKAKFGTGKSERSDVPRKVAPGAAIGNTYDDAKRHADATIREEAGLSADTVQVFRSLRQAILRGALVEDARGRGDVGIDYLIFAQLRLALGNSRAASVGMRGISPESTVGVGDGLQKARPHVEATDGDRTFRAAIAELLAHSCLAEKDPVEAFQAFRSGGRPLRNLAGAVVAGLSLERSLNADGYQIPIHDAIGSYIAPDLRRWWGPTAELLDLLPTKERLAIVEPLVEAVTFAPWSRLKSAEITKRVLETVKGAGDSVRASMREAARSWVHPLLRFNAASDNDPISADQAEELAE